MTSATRPEPTATRGQARAWNLTLWALQTIAAAMFLFAGTTKLAGAVPTVELFDAIGAGQWFRYLTGALEVAGAVLLVVPRYAAHAALLLVGVMVGAVLTELVVLGGDPLPALVFLVLAAVVAWGRRSVLKGALR